MQTLGPKIRFATLTLQIHSYPMEYKQLIAEFLGPSTKSIYIIHSEEVYFLDQITHAASNEMIPPEQRDFNQTVMHGKDISGIQLVEMAREYPFMGNRRLLLVKESQEIKQLDPLITYMNHPNPQTLMILLFSKKPDGRSNWVKLAKSLSFYYEYKGLSDYQVPGFVREMVKEQKITMEDRAMSIMMEYIGNDLATYHNELQKLKIIFPTGSVIKEEDIIEFIGVSKEFNVFELQKAFSERNKAKIYWIGQNMAKQVKTNPLVMTIGALFNHFQKIWLTKVYIKLHDEELNKILKLPFKTFIKDYRVAAGLYSINALESAIGWLKVYDLKSKGVQSGAAKEEDLYLELIFRLSQV